MKRGFTLVELLAVIVLIAIIAIIGVGGIARVNKNINIEMCNSTVNLIETGAVHYGEDFKNQLNTQCTVDEINYNKCLRVSVGDLINWGYINAKQEQVIKNPDNTESTIKVVVNQANNDEVLNNKNVYIYLDNDIVYAKLMDVNCK